MGGRNAAVAADASASMPRRPRSQARGGSRQRTPSLTGKRRLSGLGASALHARTRDLADDTLAPAPNREPVVVAPDGGARPRASASAYSQQSALFVTSAVSELPSIQKKHSCCRRVVTRVEKTSQELNVAMDNAGRTEAAQFAQKCCRCIGGGDFTVMRAIAVVSAMMGALGYARWLQPPPNVQGAAPAATCPAPIGQPEVVPNVFVDVNLAFRVRPVTMCALGADTSAIAKTLELSETDFILHSAPAPCLLDDEGEELLLSLDQRDGTPTLPDPIRAAWNDFILKQQNNLLVRGSAARGPLVVFAGEYGYMKAEVGMSIASAAKLHRRYPYRLLLHPDSDRDAATADADALVIRNVCRALLGAQAPRNTVPAATTEAKATCLVYALRIRAADSVLLRAIQAQGLAVLAHTDAETSFTNDRQAATTYDVIPPLDARVGANTVMHIAQNPQLDNSRAQTIARGCDVMPLCLKVVATAIRNRSPTEIKGVIGELQRRGPRAIASSAAFVFWLARPNDPALCDYEMLQALGPGENYDLAGPSAGTLAAARVAGSEARHVVQEIIWSTDLMFLQHCFADDVSSYADARCAWLRFLNSPEENDWRHADDGAAIPLAIIAAAFGCDSESEACAKPRLLRLKRWVHHQNACQLGLLLRAGECFSPKFSAAALAPRRSYCDASVDVQQAPFWERVAAVIQSDSTLQAYKLSNRMPELARLWAKIYASEVHSAVTILRDAIWRYSNSSEHQIISAYIALAIAVMRAEPRSARSETSRSQAHALRIPPLQQFRNDVADGIQRLVAAGVAMLHYEELADWYYTVDDACSAAKWYKAVGEGTVPPNARTMGKWLRSIVQCEGLCAADETLTRWIHMHTPHSLATAFNAPSQPVERVHADTAQVNVLDVSQLQAKRGIVRLLHVLGEAAPADSSARDVPPSCRRQNNADVTASGSWRLQTAAEAASDLAHALQVSAVSRQYRDALQASHAARGGGGEENEILLLFAYATALKRAGRELEAVEVRKTVDAWTQHVSRWVANPTSK